MGIEVLLRFLAACNRNPRIRSCTGPTGTGDGNASTIGDITFRRWERQPVILTGQISHHLFPPILPVTLVLVEHFSKLFVAFMERTRFPSSSSPMNSMV